MLGTILKSLAVGGALGATLAVAAEPAATGAANPHGAAVESGSSAAVPAGKVRLPALPYAKMPDTRPPQTPRLAPLPGETKPAAARPNQD